MLKNPTTILLTLVILIAIGIGLYLMKSQEKESSSAIMAIPEDAVLVIETTNYHSLVKNFNRDNRFRDEFSDLEQLKGFFGETAYVDSLLTANEDFRLLLEGNKIAVSGHMSANNTINFLYVVPLKDRKSDETINRRIADIFSDEAAIRQRLYDGFTINDVVFFKEGKLDFSYAFANGLFIMSASKIVIESSVRRLKNKRSLADEFAFQKLTEAAGKNVDANIYINYKYLPNVLKNLLGNKRYIDRFYEFLKGFATWTEFDLKLKSNAFLLSGFTFANDSIFHYLNVIQSQASKKNDFLEAMPGNTAGFIALNLSNGNDWKDAYLNYLQKSNEYQVVAAEIDKFDKFGRNPKSDIFYENIYGGLAMVYTRILHDEGKPESFLVMQMRDADAAYASLLEALKLDTVQQEPTPIGQNSAFKAYTFRYPRIFAHLFGKPFGYLNSNYFIKFKDYLVFGETIGSLQNYLMNMGTGKRLIDSKAFDLYTNSISSESNLFVYADLASSKGIIFDELNEKYQKLYTRNLDKLAKIEAIALQFASKGKLLSSTLYIGMGQGMKHTAPGGWQVPLEGGLSMKPQIVKSHLSSNNEVLLQDNANNLMLISESGKILWKKKLSGKILGEIHQVDIFKNNKYQFLFNTREYLYLIDRNGKDVDAYPIKLKSPATNGMAVFDYDKDRNYRILIACENKGVFLLNTSGGKVDGWVFGQTESEVTLPAEHFVANNKDYIVFADKTKTYIVNRRGETRFTPKNSFAKSPISRFYFERGESESESRFVTSSQNGEVYLIYLDGTVKKMTIQEFSPNHQFIYTDMDGDGKNQFIFADKNRLYIFNRDKSVRLEKKFNGDISKNINLYRIEKKARYIGVAPEGSGKIYLINQKGNTLKGFPLPGNSPFSIGRLTTAMPGNQFDLVVAGSDNFLLNHKIGTTTTEGE
jgi:hypothetical protein